MKNKIKTKTFRGKSMADALNQVKSHFGRHAVILNTRTMRRSAFWGVGGRECVEITAARSLSDVPTMLRRGSVPMAIGAPSASAGSDRALALPAPMGGPAPAQNSVLTEIVALKSMVTQLMRDSQRAQLPDVPEALHDSYLALIRNEVAQQLAGSLIARVQSELSADQLRVPSVVKERLAAAVEAMLPTAGPVRLSTAEGPTIVALVGPTGVGKTTTIAKLAANFRLREQRKVGLITIDTYRIAAVAQLKTYAEIIETPLEVVVSAEQLRDAVARLSDQDLILIDTAGRSQRDTIKIKELQRFFAAVRPHEVHLVLSGTAGETVLAESIERFKVIGIDRVIFTKLDEAVGFGVILSCLSKASARLSYVTTGQDVPDDIAVAEGATLADLILGKAADESTRGARRLVCA